MFPKRVIPTFHKFIIHYRTHFARRFYGTGTLTNQSYACSKSDHQLLGSTIGDLLTQQTEKSPDRDIVVFSRDKIRLTYQQFLKRVEQLASSLVALGLKPGDRIGIWSPNRVEWVLTMHAAMHIGLILVNVNPAYRVSELQHAVKNVGVKALIMADQFKTQNFYEMIYSICPELATSSPGHLKSHLLPELRSVVVMGKTRHPGSYLFDDLFSLASSDDRNNMESMKKKVMFDQPINIQFTSGTTGSPKGATLTHHNIINNAYLVGLRLKYDKETRTESLHTDIRIEEVIVPMETRICVPVPLYHCMGMVLGQMMAVTHGATCVYPSPSFEAEAALKSIEQERCTSLYGTPTMFIDILNHPNLSKYNLKSLRTGIMAGSPCPVEVMKQVNLYLHMPEVCIAYGSTETSPVTFLTYPSDTLEKRCGTVGSLLDHTEAKIVDENGDVVQIGMPGELCTRGYSTMLGYWNNKEKTDQAISTSRWYHSGDIAIMDEDGYVVINGRIKDMVIRGGENIYPVEIEQFLYTHPFIEDVQVIGVPDKRYGEQVCAVIRIKPGHNVTEQEVKDFCKGKISHFKIPHYIMFVDNYPMTINGKVQKYKLREDAVKRFCLEHEAP